MNNILFISTQVEPPWGGGEELWSDAALQAGKHGNNAAVMVSERSELHPKLKKMEDIKIPIAFWPSTQKPLGIVKRILIKIGVLKKPINYWDSVLDKLDSKPDVICLSQGGTFCSLYIRGLVEWLQQCGIPYLIICHSNRRWVRPSVEFRNKARMLFTGAKMVCFVSKENLAELERYLGLKLNNARIVHNPVNLPAAEQIADGEWRIAEGAKLVPSSVSGIDSDFLPVTRHSPPVTATELPLLDAGRSTLDAKAPEARMACVARFVTRDKGQDLLLEALGDPVWRERDFRLDFFGSGPDREILEDLISFYGLGDKVRIVGFESDIRKIWKEHHLLVLPSLSEGTPISLIEAQLCGRAALVTRVDGNLEWVEEGKTGFLAEAPTVHHLRLALERAWENRHRWAEMGEAARAACLAKRDPDPAGTLLRLLKAAAEA